MRAADGRPLNIAHAGGAGEFPGNTLEACFNAYAADPAVMFETDVSLTCDGVLILCHDRTLDRTTDRTGFISDWDYEYLRAEEVDFGFLNPPPPKDRDKDTEAEHERELIRFRDPEGRLVTPLDVDYSPATAAGLIPDSFRPRHESKFLVTTLEELLRTFPNSFVNVDIKQRGAEGRKALDALVALLDRLEGEGLPCFDRVVIASFHRSVYKTVQRLREEKYPRIMCSPETAGVIKFYVAQSAGAESLFRDEVTVFQVPFRKYAGISAATHRFTEKAHSIGIAVHYWTVNREEDMARLTELGADGLITDYPHALKNFLDKQVQNI